MPKISFITSAFHRPGRLRTFLACLVDQTFTDWECIVTDNSTDNALAFEQMELCKIDHRIRYMNTWKQASIGHPFPSLYTAAEIGVAHSEGEFLTFPNDDTYVVPVYAEWMIQHAEAEHLDFVYCDLVLGRHDRGYQFFRTSPVSCGIDKTCFMFKREWFPPEWPGKRDRYTIADGDLVVDVVNRGARVGKVEHCLVYHN